VRRHRRLELLAQCDLHGEPRPTRLRGPGSSLGGRPAQEIRSRYSHRRAGSAKERETLALTTHTSTLGDAVRRFRGRARKLRREGRDPTPLSDENAPSPRTSGLAIAAGGLASVFPGAIGGRALRNRHGIDSGDFIPGIRLRSVETRVVAPSRRSRGRPCAAGGRVLARRLRKRTAGAGTAPIFSPGGARPTRSPRTRQEACLQCVAPDPARSGPWHLKYTEDRG